MTGEVRDQRKKMGERITPATCLRIALLDDHQLFRDGLSALLCETHRMRINKKLALHSTAIAGRGLLADNPVI